MHTPFTANTHSGFDAVLDNTSLNSDGSITINTGNRTGQTVTIKNDGTVLAPLPTALQPLLLTKQSENYLDINYLQPVDGSTTTVAETYSPNGNGQGGNQTFPATPVSGTTGLMTSSFSTMTPDTLSLNYSWTGSAYVDSFSSNPTNPYMGAVEMVCQIVPGNGISGTASPTPSGIGPQSGTYSNLKSTDVLVTSNATPVLNATDLANLTANTYYEDCSQGDTLPASVNTQTTTYINQMQFDANGNLSATHLADNNQPVTVTLTAAQVTAMLKGTPQPDGTSRYFIIQAYKFTSAYGTPRYVIVEHGGTGTSASSISSGFVGVWVTGS